MPWLRPFAAAALAALLAGCAAGPAPAQSPSTRADAFQLPRTPPTAPIRPDEYAGRRAALAAGLDDGVLVSVGAVEPSADYLPFSQISSFRYLTGVNEPGAVLLVAKRGGQVREMLFVRPRNPDREVWEGARLGAERAQALTGLPARTIDELIPVVDSLLQGGGTLYTTSVVADGGDPLAVRLPDQQVVASIAARHAGVGVVSVDDQVQQLRAVKTPAELDLIRRAAYITVLAHRAAARTLEPEMNEFEIQALIEYTFRRHGAERPGFASIVGSGPNSTTLHYNANDRFMQAGEVVVMDIGAGYRGYTADVTRTLPVSGTFSPEQRQVYEIVLAAQKAAEELARPGATFQALSQAAQRVLTEGLTRLGLIESPDGVYDCATGRCPQFRLFYMHGLGHGIGLDVHDPDAAYYGAFRQGSAFTIEPGIYVRTDALDYLPDTPANRAMIQRLRPALERYRDIGVRIEDDYLITADGVERISAGAPREIAEIEALMRQPGTGRDDRRPEVVDWYRATTVH